MTQRSQGVGQVQQQCAGGVKLNLSCHLCRSPLLICFLVCFSRGIFFIYSVKSVISNQRESVHSLPEIAMQCSHPYPAGPGDGLSPGQGLHLRGAPTTTTEDQTSMLCVHTDAALCAKPKEVTSLSECCHCEQLQQHLIARGEGKPNQKDKSKGTQVPATITPWP